MERQTKTPDATPSPIRYELHGSFNGGPVKVEIHRAPGSKKVVVNLHGTYGNMHGNSGKYREMAERVAGGGSANVVLYATSRNWKLEAESDGSYESRIECFRGKRFEDELSDARSVLSDIVTHSEKRFATKSDELEITLHGNSLGGVIAFYLAAEFPQVRSIITVGTGLRLAPADVPILSTFPDAEEVRAKLAAFHGDYLLQCGTEDEVFLPEAFEEFFASAKTHTKRAVFLRYAGVDHSFKRLYGQKDPRAFGAATERLIGYLTNGELPDGDVELGWDTGIGTGCGSPNTA